MLLRFKSLGTPAEELRLMYAFPAWSPSLSSTQQQQLENVRKRACRVILGPAYTNYNHSLTTLSLPRLFARHREALLKLGKGMLRHPRLRHLLPPSAHCPVLATHHNGVISMRALRINRYH
ncbi:hypothetical protein E2C01_080202 [Portunus trituberculatus]|uniref:Uncharacterized protein n=1 Tax=Portunus trituberculatus TaxID=210409 RepID=A0A5B7IVD5_PORTR|nr:hypothetical protein [Portunus trituberculatus]